MTKETQNVAIQKKLSMKTVFGTVKDIRSAAESFGGKPKPIVRVMGVANKTRAGEGDNGPWVAFLGQFEFINLITGESFVGGKAFLPNPVSDMVEAQLEDNDRVQFAFDITVKEDESSAVGYEYGAQTVLSVQENDPLAMLKAQVMKDAPLQLENKGKEKAKEQAKEKAA